MNETANPTDDTRMAEAEALAQAGNLQGAADLYQQVLQENTQNPTAFYKLANLLAQARQWGAAEHHFKQAIALKPDYFEALNNLALVYHSQNRLEEAIAAYEKALAINPKLAQPHNNMAAALRSLGRMEEAAEHYRAALAEDPAFLQAAFNYGNTLNDLGQPQEAIAQYRAAIAINPAFSPAHAYLGNALKVVGQLEEAVESYRAAIALEPNVSSTHSNLGITLKSMGKMEEALVHYQKALELEPAFPEAHNNLANLYKELGELDKAMEHYRTGLQILMERNATNPPRPREYMDVETAHKALLALKSALDAENVPFFLAYGTLLGIIRDGKLLPHDKDMDVGVAWDTPRDALTQAMAKHGFLKSFPGIDAAEKDQWSITYLHQNTDITIDIFFFKPDGDTVISGIYHRPTPLFWRFTAFETEEHHWLDQTWHVPTQPERYLEEIYGEDWQTPNAHFDSLISGHNRNPEALTVALCFCYNRLFERANRSEWEKAAGYCRQILQFSEDPFIEKLGRWVAEQKENTLG